MIYAILIYALAMTLANLSIHYFGPVLIPINAFFLIGLDLALRDWLHVRLKPWQMCVLIAGSGLVTYLLAPSAAHIAIASAVAFSAAAVADWVVFSAVRGRWIMRANWSNLAGAAVDSVVFPWMVYKGLDWSIVATMFGAKVAGGFVWSLMLQRFLAPVPDKVTP